jgi:hypothetical protein
MVTPIHWRLVLPLIEGLRAQLIVRNEAAKRLFPQIKPIDFRTAVHLALGRIQRDNVETSWSDALVTTAGDIKPYTFTVEDGMFIERRQALLELDPGAVFRSYMGIGGCTWTGRGASAAGWTRQLAASVCGAGGVIPTRCVRASRSISGASNRWSRTVSCACAPK